MDPADLLGAGEIGDRTGDAEHAMEAARRQAHGRRGIGEQPAPGSSGVATWSSSSPSASAFVRTPLPL